MLKKFTLPLVVDSAMIKVRKKLSKEDFRKEIEKFEKIGILKREILENEKIEIENFILTRDGSLASSSFSGTSPYSFWNPLFRIWLGIPAPIWIIFDLMLILDFFYNNFFIFRLRNFFGIFWVLGFLFLISFLIYTLYIIIFDHLKKIRKYDLGSEVYHRWIFVFFPLIIVSYVLVENNQNFLYLILNPESITTLFGISLVLYFTKGSKCHLDEYLGTLPRALKNYKILKEKIEEYNKKSKEKIEIEYETPVCWLMLKVPLKKLDSNLYYLGLHFKKFFVEEIHPINWRTRLKEYLKKIKYIFGLEDVKFLDDIQKKLTELETKKIVDKNLYLPYVMDPIQVLDQLSGYCLINYSEERILGINLPKEVADSMAEKGNLWKAKGLTEVERSYMKYHSDVISKMKMDILNPIDPLIDPSNLKMYLYAVKNYISSLIRLEGLLHFLNNFFEDKSEEAQDTIKELIKEFEELKNKYQEFLESSSIISDIENTENIQKLNTKVITLTILLLLIGVLQVIFRMDCFPCPETPYLEEFLKPIETIISNFPDSFNLTIPIENIFKFLRLSSLSIIIVAFLNLLISQKHFKKMITLIISLILILWMHHVFTMDSSFTAGVSAVSEILLIF
jgi:hypothetical protein